MVLRRRKPCLMLRSLAKQEGRGESMFVLIFYLLSKADVATASHEPTMSNGKA